MLGFAALTGPFPKAGVIAVAALVAAALLSRSPRASASAICGALILAPVLLLADIWHSPQLRLIHRHPLAALIAAVALIAALVAAAVLLDRRRWLLGPLAFAALPFRIPIEAGGTTSNLLVPLYLVVAAGSLSFAFRALRDRRGDPGAESPRVRWVRGLLALYVLLYALQSIYSSDFEKALQQMVFFYVPFALLLTLLVDLDWTPALVRMSFAVIVALALVFAGIGFVEYATKSILLNPKLVVANDLHAYFTVNSVFFDPDIFGRFLALVMIGLAAMLVYDTGIRGERDADATHSALRRLGAVTVPLAVLWCGLVLTLSRSSLGALLVGLATLAALRWRVSRTVAAAAAVLALGGIAIAASPKTFGLNQGLNGASSGRANLVGGGLDLFADRPVWGYGSGSFVREYRLRNPGSSQTVSASHTIPITIAAEQGVIGELAYLALVIAAALALVRGARGDPARAAIAAAFLALIFHTFLYADFLEDPMTWAILGVGCALASRPLAGARLGDAEHGSPSGEAVVA